MLIMLFAFSRNCSHLAARSRTRKYSDNSPRDSAGLVQPVHTTGRASLTTRGCPQPTQVLEVRERDRETSLQVLCMPQSNEPLISETFGQHQSPCRQYWELMYCGFRAVIQTDSFYSIQQTEQLYRQRVVIEFTHNKIIKPYFLNIFYDLIMNFRNRSDLNYTQISLKN